MDRAVVLLGVVMLVGMLGQWWKYHDGRVRGVLADEAPGRTSSVVGRWSGLPVEAADIVAALNPSTALTFVEFTAPNCVPCTATAVVLNEVSAGRDEVAVVALDVADAPDLARAHRIMRAPTTMLLSDKGHLLGRVSGVPDAADLERLLDQALSGEPATC